jgi:hypothetical protein
MRKINSVTTRRGVAEGHDGNARVRDVMSDGIRWAYEDDVDAF